jgi:hypothetical protein
MLNKSPKATQLVCDKQGLCPKFAPGLLSLFRRLSLVAWGSWSLSQGAHCLMAEPKFAIFPRGLWVLRGGGRGCRLWVQAARCRAPIS